MNGEMNGLCNRCGVKISGIDKRETKNHCGFCSSKLGLSPEIDYGNSNIVTDPTNSTSFIIIGLGIVIITILIFGVTGSFDSHFKGVIRDEKVSDNILAGKITPEFCEKLKILDKKYLGNGYAGDSRRAIDSALIECEYVSLFGELELIKEPTNFGGGRR